MYKTGDAALPAEFYANEFRSDMFERMKINKI